ncbi:hypothetical protein D1872_244720 [compost metagenome]
MMRRTDGIAPDFFELDESIPPDLRGDSCSETACILMNAESLHLGHGSINIHPFSGDHLNCPDAHVQCIAVNDLSALHQRQLQSI